jgi:hypothetical protein
MNIGENQIISDQGNSTRDVQGENDHDRERRRFFAIQQERGNCRFGFPHPKAAQTHLRTNLESRFTVRGDRDIILRRRKEEDRHVNPYNPVILKLWQANMDIQAVSDPFAAICYMLGYITKDERSERDSVREALAKMPESATSLQLMTRLGNAIISHREVSKEEAMMLLLSEQLVYTSTSSVFIPAFPPDKRRKSTLSRKTLQNRDPTSTEIWQTSMMEQYPKRPRGDIWDTMTLREYAAWFQVVSVERAGADSDLPGDSNDFFEAEESSAAEVSNFERNPRWRQTADEPPFVRKANTKTSKLPRFSLGQNGPQIRLRRASRCVTSPMGSSANLNSKYALLACHVPFRSEYEDLFGVPEGSIITEEMIEEALARHKEDIERQKRIIPLGFAQRISELFSQLETRMREEPDFANRMEMSLQAQNLPDPNQDFETMESLGVGLEVELDRQAMDEMTLPPRDPGPSIVADLQHEEDFEALVSKLSSEQAQVVNIIQRYLEDLDQYKRACHERASLEKANQALPFRAIALPAEPAPPIIPRLLVMGPGGTGKSFLIRVLVLLLRRWAHNRITTEPSPRGGCLLAAPTGIAAFNIGGTTIHHLFRLPVEKRGNLEFQPLRGAALNAVRSSFTGVKLLIIDEVSMVSSKIFDLLNSRLNQIFQTSDEGFFGNLALCFVGDYAQLPPVCGLPIFDIRANNWLLYRQLFSPILLHIPQRQRNDKDFAELLNRARLGKCSTEDIIQLNSRSLQQENQHWRLVKQELEQEFQDATYLFPRRKDVAEHNHKRVRELALLTGQPVYSIRAADKVTGGKETDPRRPVPDDPDKTGGLLSLLEITVGSQARL